MIMMIERDLKIGEVGEEEEGILQTPRDFWFSRYFSKYPLQPLPSLPSSIIY